MIPQVWDCVKSEFFVESGFIFVVETGIRNETDTLHICARVKGRN